VLGRVEQGQRYRQWGLRPSYGPGLQEEGKEELDAGGDPRPLNVLQGQGEVKRLHNPERCPQMDLCSRKILWLL
jgi:hypothetical protein